MLVFVLLARAYVDGGLVVSFDDNVSRWVADNLPGSIESIARVVTWLGGVIGASVVTVVAVVVLWRASRRADAAVPRRCLRWHQRCSSPVLKAVYERARPDLGTVIPLPHSYSFPSGHAATAVVLYGALGVLLAERASSRLRAVGWLAGAAVLALAIGTSRVLLNVHFVSDVAAGFAVGLAWLCCCLIVRDVLRETEAGRGFSLSPGSRTARIRPWPTRRTNLSRSCSRSSEPSSTGFVSTFDPVQLTARQEELEALMGAPGFWDDQQQAARISTEHSRVTRRLDRYHRLNGEVEEARELFEMDPSLEDELREQLMPVSVELSRLQEDALFDGKYDAGDAVVSINAGTGGTDAQDWAEMMLRMYLRWSADRGYQTELVEASPGEEAGLKSATMTVKGENAYGAYKAERGVHRLVRQSPFDSAHRRHTAFAQVVVAPLLPEDEDVEIDEGDLRIDTYRASGAGGQHVNKTDSAVRITHLPTGIVVQCQNERSQTSNKATAMRILKSRLAELQEEQREEEIARERGATQDIGFGSQIRSYVLHPYQMVKDHRTDFEAGNAQGVLDGNLDGFVRAYLLAKAAGKVV